MRIHISNILQILAEGESAKEIFHDVELEDIQAYLLPTADWGYETVGDMIDFR